MLRDFAFLIIVSFGISWLLYNPFISLIKRIQPQGQPIRKHGPESHVATKKNIYNMGGLLILASSLISYSAYLVISYFGEVDLINLSIIFTMLSFSLIGFVDDYQKVKSKQGISAKNKALLQFILSLAILYFLDYHGYISYNLSFLGLSFDLGYAYIPFASIFIITGSSNAANLTDGLDGLLVIIVCIILFMFAILNPALTIICYIMIGACLFFFYHNTHPASIFMGDSGSLALGAILGIMSIISKHEIEFFIASGVLVLETFSVAIQVIFYKMTRKRFFRMAPIHHHFELKGIAETKIAARFWIVTILLSIIAISVSSIRYV